MNVILLTPHGRSGSYLMQSLFDQHPQVSSLPTVFFYPEWKFHNSTKECIKEFVNLYPGIFNMHDNYLGIPGKNVTSMFGKEGTENIILSKEIFIENAYNIFKSKLSTGISRKDFVQGIHLAYSKTLGNDPEKIKYLLLHMHNYEKKYHYCALEDYSNLKYIAMIRDPRENYLSSKNLFYTTTPLSKFNSHYYHMYQSTKSFKNDIENLSMFSNRVDSSQVKVVDLNRLHALKVKGMKFICKWLEVNFTETLMESTFLGKLWHGNAADRKSIKGLNSQKAKLKWPETLDKYEISFIETNLKKELIYLGYEIINTMNKNPLYVDRAPSFFNIYFHHLLVFNSDILDSFSRKKFSEKYTKFLPIFLLRLLLIFKKSLKFFEILLFSLRDYKKIKNEKISSNSSSLKINATYL